MRLWKFILLVAGITAFAVLGVYVFTKSGEPCAGCGGCSSEPFSGEAFVSDYVLDENDSLIQVSFTLKGGKNPFCWMQNPENVSRFRRKVSDEEMKDTTIFYLLHGEKIRSGSCQPYLIDSLSFLK